MAINICQDHLGGFDSKYFSPWLSDCDPGQVQVEYILPDQVKQLYPQLEIQFSAFLMVRNNHFEKFLNLPEPEPIELEDRTNFLCSFNKSKHISRLNFVLSLFVEGLYNPDFCSKYFFISDKEWMDFIKQLPEDTQSKVSLGATLEFIHSVQQYGGHPKEAIGQIRRDLTDLSPLIRKSFITAVSETFADSYVPFPTEKICFPIANKSLWIAYAQPGYYEFIEKYMDIKPFTGIDYSFDSILDPTKRLHAVIRELKRIRDLNDEQRADLYSLNQHIFNHNFVMLTSGEMIANLWRHDESFEHYGKFANFSKIASETNSDLCRQLTSVIEFFARKEKRFQQFG